MNKIHSSVTTLTTSRCNIKIIGEITFNIVVLVSTNHVIWPTAQWSNNHYYSHVGDEILDSIYRRPLGTDS